MCFGLLCIGFLRQIDGNHGLIVGHNSREQHVALSHHITVRFGLPHQLHAFGGDKVVGILHLYKCLIAFHGDAFEVEFQILISGFHLHKFRGHFAKRCHHAVAAEIALMRAGEVVAGAQAALIGAVENLAGLVDALIHPVPDGAAYGGAAVFDAFPIFAQVTYGCTHRMGIFADKHRLFKRIDIFVHPFHAWIHLRIEVAEAVAAIFFAIASALVVHKAVVEALGSIVACPEIVAASVFVTQTPEYHARVIAVALNHALHAVYKRRYPRRHIAN